MTTTPMLAEVRARLAAIPTRPQPVDTRPCPYDDDQCTADNLCVDCDLDARQTRNRT